MRTILAFSIFILLTFQTHASESDTIEATEWCPKGTWWSYVALGTFFRYRDHEIYVYEKDTIVENRTVKKINIYNTESDFADQGGGLYKDSFTRDLRSNGHVLMYNKNDSIFAKWDVFYAYMFGLKNDNAFRFLFKLNYTLNEKRPFIVKFTDSAACKNYDTSVLISDTLTTVNITPLVFKNRKNLPCKVTSYTNSYQYNKMTGYEGVYKNMVPNNMMVNFINKITGKKLAQELYKYCQNPDFANYHGADIGHLFLYCYHQGEGGFLVDRQEGPEGCEYMSKRLKSYFSQIDAYKKENINLVVYPTLFESRIQVQCINCEDYTVKVFNLLGQEVLKQSRINLNSAIDLSEIQSSAYFLMIYNKNEQLIHSTKIVKK